MNEWKRVKRRVGGGWHGLNGMEPRGSSSKIANLRTSAFLAPEKLMYCTVPVSAHEIVAD
jgi:hypothetical protein